MSTVTASAEPNSAIYAAAREIAGKVLGVDVSPAVGAIDPSIFALLELIADLIIKVLTALRERMSPEQAVKVMRRPSWLWARRIAVYVKDEVKTDPRAAKYRNKGPKVADCLLEAGERMDESVILGGFDELDRDSFILV